MASMNCNTNNPMGASGSVIGEDGGSTSGSGFYLLLIDYDEERRFYELKAHLRALEEIDQMFGILEETYLKIQLTVLRDCYYREVQRIENGRISAWPLFAGMSFLSRDTQPMNDSEDQVMEHETSENDFEDQVMRDLANTAGDFEDQIMRDLTNTADDAVEDMEVDKEDDILIISDQMSMLSLMP